MDAELKDSLITRYRPRTFEDVVGQGPVVKSFRESLEERSSQQFIFAGTVPGIGKTSLARIGAKLVGATGHNLLEVPAAVNTSVDDMRSLIVPLGYRPLGKGIAKAVILDEAHRLSGNAWDAILKETEEPPAWVYWFFCTTNIVRIPRTIQSRCAIYTLQPVNKDVILDYLLDVAEWEGLSTPRDILTLCAYEAGGSVRNALSFLSVCRNCRTRKEAAQLIVQAEEQEGGLGFELARALMDGSWARVQPLLQRLVGGGPSDDSDAPKKDEPPAYNAEGIRQTIRAYFTKVSANAKDPKVAVNAVRILEIFSEPCNPSDGLSPIVLGCGRAVLAK